MVAAGGLAAPMLEVVVCGVGGGLLDVAEDRFRMLDREITQEATTVFPKLEIRHLSKVFDKRRRGFAPHGRGAPHREADGSSDAGDEFFPQITIGRPSAETNNL
jgi:hypothetical protein